MDPKLLPHVICRTPLFSFEDTLNDKWDELKEAIKISSKDLYEQIKDTTSEGYDQLPQKVKFSCWKYFNRARFRATPFGLFGSITLLPMNKYGAKIVLKKEPSLRSFTNWVHKDTLLSNTESLYKKANLIRANTSAYPCGDQLRYISTLEDGTFEIASIERQPVIETVLMLCKDSIAKEKIVEHLTHRQKLHLSVAEDLLMQLIELQLLLTDLHPNIIGTDYFKRVGLKSTAPQRDPYFISARSLLEGSVSSGQFKVIPEAINFIKDYLPQTSHKPLEKFKRAFQSKFEYREVRLLEALDPEIGVGYNELESSPGTDELVDRLVNNRLMQNNDQVPYTPFHQFLLNGILKGENIQLADLAKHQLPLRKATLPNTFGAIVKQVDDQLYVEQAGGCTANSLLGRFTLEEPNLTDYCKTLVAKEEAANPEVLFFDIAYQSEKKVDNVNRRNRLYNYEVTLVGWSDQEHSLPLDDLLISVRNNEVILRSNRLAKRLVPRLASAYNYSRSDLSVYRLLCDIQHQGLQTNLAVNPSKIFPNLDYYPQVTYKNVVFSPRMWKVPKKTLFSATSPVKALKKWLRAEAIPAKFKCFSNDQFLLFDSASDEDLEFFLQYTKNGGEQYITEVALPKKPLVEDELGRPYLSEMNLQFYCETKPYTAVSRAITKNSHTDALSLIGQNWLYFEIYAHSLRSDVILTETITAYLKLIKQHVSKWFFIRYSVPSPHIRLRLHLKEPKASFHKAVSVLTALLEKDIRSGVVTDLQIKNYHREIERYGLSRMDRAERCFWKESKYTLLLINSKIDRPTSYRFVLRLIDDLFKGLDFNYSQVMAFAKKGADAFADEFKAGIKEFKAINEAFEPFKEDDHSFSSTKKIERAYQTALKEIIDLLKQSDADDRLQLISDLVHMHVNRLFSSDQRVHEFIIYQFYLKQLRSRQSRLKQTV
ncbi:lantibiotic dehydratase [Olivibacter sp. XZL3]|uniref:lantibiotic dehydratase n=1 Tax=Olivibacter sp. XZL3 TaxID=1735116 RepID=UPI001066F9DC|nr:lantibiotic dehydratase [Olivibacter sp. XZL3]